MAVGLEELIKALEMWLKLIKKSEDRYIDSDLDPVLLVPGIAGSILNAVDDNGKEERIWVRILRADHEFRDKLWSKYDPSTGRTVSLDPNTRICVPEDRYGLYAIDCLDPDMVIGREGVCYFHDMIVEMLKWGFQEGKTLFGFGYDFRQSNRLPEAMSRFAAKLESVYSASGGKKINVITHSMGGLLVKCFMSLHSDVFEKYVKNWIAIAAPFQGAPGYITTSLLNGCSFVEGWQQNFFISKWSMQQLLIECPSIYELMGCPYYDWNVTPNLEVWRSKQNTNGNTTVMLEKYEPEETLSVMKEALSNNVVNVDGTDIHVPLNQDILKWALETKGILKHAKLPPSVKFYNIYGMNCDTPHSVCYGSEQTPILDLQELLPFKAEYICVDGDGTVPVESAKADGLDAEARVGVHGDHRSVLCDRHVFRILKHWLRAGEPDPFYDPVNDYVILPTAFELEKYKGEGVQITSMKEDWEILSEDQTEKTPTMSSISVSQIGEDQSSLAEARVSAQSEGVQHVELRAVSVSTCG
ncbi:phospholipase A1 [Ranunculus cassubicifolius]